MRERVPSTPAKYLFAVAVSAAAVLVRLLLDRWLGDNLPLVTLFGAVAIAVWFGGWRPAILAAALGYLACSYLFMEPRGAFAANAETLIGMIAYLISCTIIIAFGQALRRARARARFESEMLRITLASIGDGVITTDVEGRVTELNAVAESLTGWTRAEAIGQPLDRIFRIVNERSREPVENPAVRALRAGTVVGLANHTMLIAKDGSERSIDDSAAPIRDQDGQIAGCVLIFRDVAERRRTEKALARSEEDLRDFFENAAIALHWVGPDGIILRANQTELEMLGYEAEEYVGRHIAEFHADRPVIDDILTRLAAGETLRDFPARMRHKDGSIRNVLINSNVLFEDGAFIHTRCLTRDVTNLKLASEARAQLSAIIESSDDAIVSKTLDGIIRSWNRGAQRIFGYTPDEVIGRSINMLIPPELQAEERTILERLRKGERIDHFETVRLTKHGRRLDISLTVSPIRDDTGQIVGASKVARDVTDRKRAEEELRENDRRKDEFLATLAHELRNPLAPIRNSLEIMKRAQGDAGLIQQARGTMDRQLALMERLIEDLLDISRITHNRLEMRNQPVELAAVVQQALEANRPLAESFAHEVTVDLPAEPIQLYGDPVRLAQVFGNLLNNASKYTPARGRIALSAERQGNEVVVSVKDNGIGISPEALPLVFDMFMQGDRTLERANSGLGIGLTLVRQIVQMHLGQVHAISAGVGRGSEFQVRLPILTARRTAEPATAPPKKVPARRILVVDDNRDNAESLAKLLKIAGHEMQLAHDGM
ncbi:MAG TPA: PAS domain S-box protein, partial [Candidatus Udaeobacter sp.]|nr:PAS domain S-box protein [Candidatus Udaeobacter sp.]